MHVRSSILHAHTHAHEHITHAYTFRQYHAHCMHIHAYVHTTHCMHIHRLTYTVQQVLDLDKTTYELPCGAASGLQYTDGQDKLAMIFTFENKR